MSVRLVADYPTAAAFIDAVDNEVANGGLLIRGAHPLSDNTACVVEIRLAGALQAEVPAEIATVARFGVTVSFEEVPFELVALADQLRAPAVPEEPVAPARRPATAAERLAELTVAQKIAQAMAGDRETRLALFRDNNKMLHAYVLRNPRLQLDEALFAAKLNTLAPDALKAIAEHPEWGQNPSVILAVVKNPKTPTPIALRLLPRLNHTEIRAIAKGGAKDQLVFAARKMLSG